MGTYDHKKILADYASGKMTVEQVMGHILQHIDKLYELQTTANVNRYKLRGRLDNLDKTVSMLQSEITRLTSLIEKVESK
jgi:hypothetical protein